jgi:parallel beta-helix repeat protein
MEKVNKSLPLLLFLILFVAPLVAIQPAPVKAASKTIVVPEDYSTIQAAVDRSSSGDTVLVKSGTYYQNVTINKPLSLIGEGNATTLLYGPLSSTILDPSITIQINADNVQVSGFTIKHNMIGVKANGNNIQLLSNFIECEIVLTGSYGVVANSNLTSSDGASITIKGSNNNISDTFFSDLNLYGSSNTVNGNIIGIIRLENSSSNTVSNNTGIVIMQLTRNSSYNTVSGNVIEGTSAWGILMGDGNHNIFYENNVTNLEYGGHRYGIALGRFSENNTFYHNNFFNNSQGVGWTWGLYGKKNNWDNGKEGNFWDDYRTSRTHRAWNDYNVTDDNKDGINDTPYVINEDNLDHYPLVSPFNAENNAVKLPYNERFTILLVIIAVLGTLTAIVVVGLLVYDKKRKSIKESKLNLQENNY